MTTESNSEIASAIVDLKSSDLFKYLSSLDQDLATRCELFVRNVTPLLSSIRNHFPFYTNHGAGHSAKILGRIKDILYRECLEPGNDKALTKAEAFLLIIGAYGHDLGMTILPGEKAEMLEKLGIQKKIWMGNR